MVVVDGDAPVAARGGVLRSGQEEKRPWKDSNRSKEKTNQSGPPMKKKKRPEWWHERGSRGKKVGKGGARQEARSS